MAAIVRQCSRVTVRSLTAISLRSRPAQQAILSPLLRKNLKVEWKVDLSPKYFCSNTQTVIENSNPSTASSGATGQSEVLTGESDDSELISSSSNNLHRISQRLGSVRHEETLLQAFQVMKNAEGIFCDILTDYCNISIMLHHGVLPLRCSGLVEFVNNYAKPSLVQENKRPKQRKTKGILKSLA